MTVECDDNHGGQRSGSRWPFALLEAILGTAQDSLLRDKAILRSGWRFECH